MNENVFGHMCRYFAASIICLAGEAAVQFATGRCSGYFVIVFLFPLLGGIPYAVRCVTGREGPGAPARYTYAAGVILLASGSALFGILEMAGQSIEPPVEFWLAGVLLIGTGLLLSLAERKNGAAGESACRGRNTAGHSIKRS